MITITVLLLTYNMAMDTEKTKYLKKASNTIKEIKGKFKSELPKISCLFDKEPYLHLSYKQRQLELDLRQIEQRQLELDLHQRERSQSYELDLRQRERLQLELKRRQLKRSQPELDLRQLELDLRQIEQRPT